MIAAGDGKEGAVTINQDVRVYATLLSAEESITHQLAAGRHAWLQLARGKIRVNGEDLLPGDGAVINGESEIVIFAEQDSELLLFDLA